MRAELLARLSAAQFEIEATIAQLRALGDAAGLRPSEACAADIAALQRRIGSADPGTLSQMRGEVIAIATAARTEGQRATGAVAAKEAEAAQELASVSAEARRQVEATMQRLHDFDHDLRFSSRADEEAYREREAANHRAIDAAMAKGTPEGDLEATALTHRQLLDAGAHGADASPEFATALAQNQAAYEPLRTAIVTRGGNTDAQDAIMRGTPASGPSDTGHAVAGDNRPPAVEATPADDELTMVQAALKAAGVTTKAPTPTNGAHGLAANRPVGGIANAVG